MYSRRLAQPKRRLLTPDFAPSQQHSHPVLPTGSISAHAITAGETPTAVTLAPAGPSSSTVSSRRSSTFGVIHKLIKGSSFEEKEPKKQASIDSHHHQQQPSRGIGAIGRGLFQRQASVGVAQLPVGVTDSSLAELTARSTKHFTFDGKTFPLRRELSYNQIANIGEAEQKQSDPKSAATPTSGRSPKLGRKESQGAAEVRRHQRLARLASNVITPSNTTTTTSNTTTTATPTLTSGVPSSATGSAHGKERRASFFFSSKPSSCDKPSGPTGSSSQEGDCPIYARKKVVIRRKSAFCDSDRPTRLFEEEKSFSRSEIEGLRDEFDERQEIEGLRRQISPPSSLALLHQQNAKSLSNSDTLVSKQALAQTQSLTGSGRKNSLVHEIRVLSPRNSLGGVFYSSSIISVKNSLSNELGFGDKKSTNLIQEGASLVIGERPTTTSEDDSPYRKGKFFGYFTWNSWMLERSEYSLFLFSPGSALRRECLRLADHPYFDYIVLIFISLNCITLAMERPKIPPWSKEREFLSLANYVFTVVFGIEMLIKVIAKGLFYGKEAYFKVGWNIMDGTLVGISLLDIFLGFFAQRSPRIFGILRVFRLLRSLRPLR